MYNIWSYEPSHNYQLIETPSSKRLHSWKSSNAYVNGLLALYTFKLLYNYSEMHHFISLLSAWLTRVVTVGVINGGIKCTLDQNYSKRGPNISVKKTFKVKCAIFVLLADQMEVQKYEQNQLLFLQHWNIYSELQTGFLMCGLLNISGLDSRI